MLHFVFNLKAKIEYIFKFKKYFHEIFMLK